MWKLKKFRRDLVFKSLITTKLHPEWIVGFVDGEGCASLSRSSKSKFGIQIQIEFHIAQHNRDVHEHAICS